LHSFFWGVLSFSLDCCIKFWNFQSPKFEKKEKEKAPDFYTVKVAKIEEDD
jgi:hypothetical protein